MAATRYHARQMGRSDATVDAFTVEALAALAEGEADDVNKLIALNLKCGEVSVAVLALLDQAHCDTFGKPTPTTIKVGHKPGKAILISGHDMVDLKALLDQTAGLGIDIYTHGEMIPAHGYPELKKYASGRAFRRRLDAAAARVRPLPGRDPDDDEQHRCSPSRRMRVASSPAISWAGRA